MASTEIEVAGRSDNDAGRIAAYVAAFLDHHRTQSKDTEAAYRTDLGLWFRWLADRGLHPLDVNRGAVLAWLGARADAGDAESTRARRVSAVSSWYQYLIGLDVTDRNPAALDRRQRPHVDKRKSTTLVLSRSQAEQLVAVADEDGPRSGALVALLVYTGARIGEALAADVEDITQQSGQPVLPVVGKGRRARLLPLPPATYDRIAVYLDIRADSIRLPAVAAGARPRRPLFATRTGRRMDRVQARRILRRIGRRADAVAPVVDRLSPHALRHSYATDLLADGVPIRDVSYAMGHADVSTTERYDHGDLDLDRHPTYKRAAQVKPARLLAATPLTEPEEDRP